VKKEIRILIVDDHFLVRIGLLTSLKIDSDLKVIAEASTASQALDLYRQHLPDVVLMDLRLPDSSGIEATIKLRKEFPSARVIIISSYDGEEDIYRSFQAGAQGYLLKSVLSEELFCAIKLVHGGKQYTPPQVKRSLAEHDPASDLTPREMEVLQLLIKGLSNKEIGEVLGCTENTAKFHIKNILGKLEVNDRTEAATAAFHRGILH
jgi:two-component system, NarL family, response regulator